jgi:chemotaxis protein methyltransferase CheR
VLNQSNAESERTPNFQIAMNDTALHDELVQMAVRRIGLRIHNDAHDRFVGILLTRTAHLGYASLKDYQTFLDGRQATEEWEELARLFTCGETFFFRDQGQFDLLHVRLLPELIAQHHNDKILRLWSAGCASGEEVYSLAMLVDMLLPERDGWDILILGTDINSEAIAKARCGRYGQWSFRQIPAEMQQRYFHQEGNEWLLDERIRRMVTFRVANLVSEPFPDLDSKLHGMDLILCRNVFIYFSPSAVYAVTAKFAAALREGGYLLTAHTELIGHTVLELESRLLNEGVVFQRRVRVPAESFYSPHPDKTTGETTSHSTKQQKDARQITAYYPPPHAEKSVMVYAPAQSTVGEVDLFKEARIHADRGEFDLADLLCRKALVVNPLAAPPYYLLAQLAQVRGDFNQAKECLNKAIYLDPGFVAAYLDLAALCERANDMPRAQTLRRAALGIVRTIPNDEIIEQYKTTARELVLWLVKLEHEQAL